MERVRNTFSVIFYIRRKAMNKKGQVPIYMRLTVKSVRIDSSANRMILPEMWHEGKGRAYEKDIYHRELNLYLDAMKLRVMQIHREMQLDGEHLTARRVLDKFLGKDKQRRTLIEVFREHNDRCQKLKGIDMTPSTVQKYESCLKHTQDFMKQFYGKDDIYLDELNRKFIEDYEFWFKTEKKCNHNTATKYLKNFKKIIRIALNNDWLKVDPFRDIRFHLEPVDRDFLEQHELKKVYEKPFDFERLEVVRDVFVFCCYTGLAFTDTKQLTADHISIDIHGNKWIRKPRQKTKNMCNIPLLDIPLAILDKYNEHPQCASKGVLLPVPSNQKMNSYLKEIGDQCGIRKTITTHTARHTFATLTLANGVSIENVAKMLGHSDTKMTRHYAKILDSSILRDMENARKKMYI